MSGKWETTHEFSTRRIIQLFLYVFIFGAIVGACMLVIGLYTDWYQQAAIAIINVHVQYPLIGLVYSFFIGVVALSYTRNRKKNVKEGKKHEDD